MTVNNKAIAIVVVILLAGVSVGAVALMNHGDESSAGATGRLMVYGNADNNDYLDRNDINAIKTIIDDGNWDKAKNPFADSNADGVVDNNDISYLNKLLNKEECLMYYLDYFGNASYVHYPVTGTIGATVDYGLMICSTLGIYDRVTAGTERVLGYSENRYPGCHSFRSLGTTATVESVLASGVSIVVGKIGQTLHDDLVATGEKVDQIMLGFSNTNTTGATSVDSVLTMGVLLSCEEAAQRYVAYYDSMNSYISSKVSSIPESSFILAYDTVSYTETKVDTKGVDGSMFGDAFCISHLPLKDLSEPRGNGFYTVTMESIIAADPEYIIITMWGKIDDKTSPADAQAHFDKKCDYFKETDAYREGKIFGVCYETYGTYLGIGGLGLLASYIWPDSFDEQEGWRLLQECYDDFTLLDADVRECGGLQAFRMGA